MKDKVVLITGGAAGIGKATADAFLAAGARVWIWDVNSEAIQDATAAWAAAGHTVQSAQVDVSDYNAVESAMQRILSAGDRLDVLVNNAGITMDRSLLKMDPSTWQKVIDVNLTGGLQLLADCRRHHGQTRQRGYSKRQLRGRTLRQFRADQLRCHQSRGHRHDQNHGPGAGSQRHPGQRGSPPDSSPRKWCRKCHRKSSMAWSAKPRSAGWGPLKTSPTPMSSWASDQASFITGTVISVDGGITILSTHASTPRNARIAATGHYVPERVVPNQYFNEILGEDVDHLAAGKPHHP